MPGCNTWWVMALGFWLSVSWAGPASGQLIFADPVAREARYEGDRRTAGAGSAGHGCA